MLMRLLVVAGRQMGLGPGRIGSRNIAAARVRVTVMEARMLPIKQEVADASVEVDGSIRIQMDR